MFAKFVVALAALYHLLATLAAMMAVFHFARVLRGEESRHSLWRHVFAWGEAHLWISGAILIGTGLYLNDPVSYLNNPKLWAKVSLVLLWGANSWLIRRTLHRASALRRNLMFGISTGSLLYGSFLGVAKPLAYGVLPFPWFLAGFVITIALCTYAVSQLFSHTAAAHA